VAPLDQRFEINLGGWSVPPGCRGSCEHVSSIVDRVDLSGFPVPIKLEVRCEGSYGSYVGLTLYGRDRDQPKLVIPVQSHTRPLRLESTEREVLDTIKRAALELVTHELLEHFVVDGKRIFDPHAAPPAMMLSAADFQQPATPPTEEPSPPASKKVTLTLNGRAFHVTDFNFQTKKSFDSRARIKKLKRRR
jgi:hypothetical protein